MSFSNKLLVMILVAVMVSTQTFAFVRVNTDNQFFLDDVGRVAIFHGVNAVYKIPPWLPSLDGPFNSNSSLNAEDIANLQSWGFNAVRLGVEWPGVMPTPDGFNDTYLKQVASLIDNLYASNIHTIVDCHQDVFSRKFCGEGVPDWLVESNITSFKFPIPASLEPFPVDNSSYPDLDTCVASPFFEYYFSAAVSKSFQELYTSSSAMNAAFHEYWGHLAQFFNETDGVLGYELINEPWMGDFYTDPNLVKPGYADKTNLAPLYTSLHNTIRQSDDEHIVFFEKAVSDLVFSTGLQSGPGGPSYNDRQAYSYHIYCGTGRTGAPSKEEECQVELQIQWDTDMKDLKRLGMGGFMTEFGATLNATNGDKMVDFLLNTADTRLQSWTYWQFKGFHDLTTQSAPYMESFYEADGSLQLSKVKVLSRTYAQATAGVPSSMSFDSETGVFNFTYLINTTIAEPTIIYLNEEWYYPNGYSVTVLPSNAVNVTSPTTNYLNLYPTSAVAEGVTAPVQSGDEVNVVITRN
eukprot:TRINITY_DN14960_c0_g1_i1.p1 TRINITY_DN14960_c0_g1~~TRINITY_DN14960_c0_g1_i1.p1  ORF type:complete len:561 (-),score=78.10 TRINITY_DN14960_c0_g1_i1:15-1577(-)